MQDSSSPEHKCPRVCRLHKIGQTVSRIFELLVLYSMYILEVPQALDGRLNSSSTASTIVIPASKKLRQQSSLTLYGKVRLHLSSLSLLCLSLQIRRGTHESWSFQLTLGHVRRQISSWNPGNRENRPNTHSPTPMSIGDGGDFEEECTATCPQQSRLTCKDDELACKKVWRRRALSIHLSVSPIC